MAQAYDFAIDKIGLDIMSFSIWNDYVTFLKSVEAVGSYAENQKITAIRKVCFHELYFGYINVKIEIYLYHLFIYRFINERLLPRC